jgi:hypothetical protein
MFTKKMTREQNEKVVLGPQDGAFVFRRGKGLELYLPKESPPGPASDEAMMAAMLAWISSDKEVMDEMFNRFRAYCQAEAAKRKQ